MHEIIGDSTYKYLVDHFSSETIYSKYDTLEIALDMFIAESNINVRINKPMLQKAMMDYFADIYRLEKFLETKNEKISTYKTDSYTSYWLHRRPAIVPISPTLDDYCINDRFICAFIISSCLSRIELEIPSINIETIDEDILKVLTNQVRYHLLYRNVNPNSIELMMIAFDVAFKLGYKASNTITENP